MIRVIWVIGMESTERRIARDVDAEALAEVDQLGLDQIRVTLDLVNRRHDGSHLQGHHKNEYKYS